MSATVIGDAFIDMIVPVQGIRAGETYHRKIIMLCGGTANVAIQIAKLVEKAKFVGKVGNDVFGMYFKQNLEINGVEDLTFVDERNPTGLCISMVYDDGERAMVANRGANDHFKKEEIKSCIERITDSKIVYFSGYSLLSEKNAESILYVIERCHKQNCEIYFNPGAPNLIREEFKSIIFDFVDVLILNMEEAKSMTKKNEIKDIIKSISDMVDVVVITMGEGGCIVSRSGDYAAIPTRKVRVVDTTGAGDAFAAGFIVGKLRNMDDVKSAKLGNETAARFLRGKMELMQ